MGRHQREQCTHDGVPKGEKREQRAESRPEERTDENFINLRKEMDVYIKKLTELDKKKKVNIKRASIRFSVYFSEKNK